jgi:hypothetical protein
MSSPPAHWPCNRSDLTRRLGYSQQEPEFGNATRLVGRILRDLGCPKNGSSQQAHRVVDEEMGHKAARRLGRTLS